MNHNPVLSFALYKTPTPRHSAASGSTKNMPVVARQCRPVCCCAQHENITMRGRQCALPLCTKGAQTEHMCCVLLLRSSCSAGLGKGSTASACTTGDALGWQLHTPRQHRHQFLHGTYTGMEAHHADDQMPLREIPNPSSKPAGCSSLMCSCCCGAALEAAQHTCSITAALSPAQTAPDKPTQTNHCSAAPRGVPSRSLHHAGCIELLTS